MKSNRKKPHTDMQDVLYIDIKNCSYDRVAVFNQSVTVTRIGDEYIVCKVKDDFRVIE